MKNIVIIGGGASGLMAAISAAKRAVELKRENEVKILILERCDKVGRKLLATGNGRCNLTNQNKGVEFYHSNNIELVDKVMSQFAYWDTVKLLEGFGLMLINEDDGKLYPYSLQASAVLDVLRSKASEYGVVEKCSFEADSVIKTRKGFMIKGKNGESINADTVIIAAGGCASPNLGSNGSGHKLLKSLGHRISDIFPAITQIKTETDIVKSIQGIRVNSKLTLEIGDEAVREESGEILFTDYGISGPPAFKMARIVGETIRNRNNRNEIFAVIDLVPEIIYEELIGILIDRRDIFEGKTIEQFMLGTINKRVGQAIVKISGFKLTDDVSILELKNIELLAWNLKNFKLKCIGTQDFQNAQVTAGGALLSEFDEKTLESRIVPGLFACGEVLDVDGECGGYNLQWAWSSGYIAGLSTIGN